MGELPLLPFVRLCQNELHRHLLPQGQQRASTFDRLKWLFGRNVSRFCVEIAGDIVLDETIVINDGRHFKVLSRDENLKMVLDSERN
jgi:hypothetical protein